MEGFTIIDGVVAGVIVLSAILAYSRGLVRESMAILGWILAAVAAYAFAAQAQPLIRELPVVGDFIGTSCELSLIAAFAAVFAICLVIAALFTPLLSTWVNQSILGGLDQALGFLFGVVRGVVLVAVAFIVYDRAVAADTIPMVDNSRSAKVFATFQGNLDEQLPSDAPGWIVAKYEGLVAVCAAPAENAAPAANN
ncbi:membrane protein required for colicin V production [Gemmobacter aquatilis]|uniref:Membrane protein required for colicin V production n=1 Tax=Gemmobacter aquatilis TaxID=933059 RepID=A0A1H8FQK3_9RHOB|nr:CvpA family protein [Gemmobacter aquatilis]SEN33527.1 membrane protein required for colicin V production [Gemmobacter aquatilis]